MLSVYCQQGVKMNMATKFIVNILFFSINILIANLAISGTIYAINSDNDALEQFDTGDGNSTTLESLSFYSQGQTVFDPETNKAYIFDGNNDRVIEYNFTTNTSANIAVSSNGDQIQSLIGFDANGDLIVTTDDYGEDKSTAKRFGKLTLTGTLTRIGAPLVSGSAYPQGNQLYDSINNKIYTISNDSSKVFSILDLNTNTASSFSTAGSSLVAFSADNNIAYSVVTGTEDPKVLSLNLSSGTETTLTSTRPTGYDNFASSGYVDIANEELAIFVGGSGVSGVAIYSTVDGSFKRVISTSGTGRFVSMGTIKSVESGVEEFSEDITSTVGDFIKIGAGELNVTGDSSSAGGTYVEEGKLRINGSFESSSVEISTDATLGGAGTVASIVNDGTVAPGNSIGTLNVSGSVVLNSGSVLVIEVDANGNSDKIVATGAVTAGGTLRISPESGSYTEGQQYTIITGSSVSGTFASVSVLSCSGTATPTYGSTSITFSLSNCSVSRPTNVSTIISYINDLDTSSSADLQSVVTALNNLTGTEYEAAVATLDANSQTNVEQAAYNKFPQSIT